MNSLWLTLGRSVIWLKKHCSQEHQLIQVIRAQVLSFSLYISIDVCAHIFVEIEMCLCIQSGMFLNHEYVRSESPWHYLSAVINFIDQPVLSFISLLFLTIGYHKIKKIGSSLNLKYTKKTTDGTVLM